jgi:hypothetical protein
MQRACHLVQMAQSAPQYQRLTRAVSAPVEDGANTADNPGIYAPPSTLGLQRIGRGSPKSAALVH